MFIPPSKFPTQSVSTCTWKSSCINSMGSSFLWPVIITQHTLVNSALCCQRSCPGPTLLRYHVCRVSAPCDWSFELCTAVLNCDRATHGVPADRAPVYRDPLGCPLIPRQDGTRDKAPTLWLLQLLRLLQLLHACACGQHWTCFHKHTPLVKYTLTWISTDLACIVTHRTSSIVPELKVQKLKVCPDCNSCVTTSNQLVVHECFVLNHFCCCSRFDFSDIFTCSLELLEKVRLLAFDTSTFTTRS